MLIDLVIELALLGALSVAIVYGMWYVGLFMDAFMRSVYGME
ncbi:hypothetical protein [uncultured Mediterranean phage]|nr:hypothetical protein [uncultured Mediterranean phage]